VDLHKKEHKAFVKKIKAFRESYTGYDEQAIEKLVRTLSGWILEHILKDDKKLGE